jgi:F0F1-type ATP synthase membrane subunit b/b'
MVEEGTPPPDAGGRSQAALLAAQQVESIVAAAQGAADELTRQAEAEAEQIRTEARKQSEHELAEGRRQATALGKEARETADTVLKEARHDAQQEREQAHRAAEARVAAAEKAAEDVLAEAKVLSTGLRRLGESLSEQGERILRDVTGAHRRMQADLRVGPAEEPAPTPRRADSGLRRGEDRIPRRADPREEELLATVKEAEEQRSGDEPRRRRGRENPIEDLDVPNWVDGE